MKEQIIKKLQDKHSDLNMGETLNLLQDIAETSLDHKTFRDYLIKSNKDCQRCEGQDGMFINGRYFDWKQFEREKYNIVNAFLDYFSKNSLQTILNVL